MTANRMGSKLNLLTGALTTFGVMLLALPVEAATLQFWRFDTNENRLVFLTDSGVQPRAQFIANPSRVVIDLPGTTLGRPTVRQSFGGAVQEVRVGQADVQTTRIVIELSPGYTLNPDQVRVRGATAAQWSVQLPSPQRF
nr:AMIN domain-containing protein [Oculatella sp. LEGE 06141]